MWVQDMRLTKQKTVRAEDGSEREEVRDNILHHYTLEKKRKKVTNTNNKESDKDSKTKKDEKKDE